MLRALAASKATGWDEVCVEVYRASKAARDGLFDLVIGCVRDEEVPWELVLGEFVCIFKNKGSPEDMANYRFICLLNHGYKLLSGWLLRRCVKDTSGYLSEHQAGFRAGRATRDDMYALASLFDEIIEAESSCVATFVDYTAAFDSVSHKFMDAAIGVALEETYNRKLQEFETAIQGGEAGGNPVLSHKVRAMFRAVYAQAKARVRVVDSAGARVYSEPFRICRGVVQGDIFSPLCFIMALELIMRRYGGPVEVGSTSSAGEGGKG